MKVLYIPWTPPIFGNDRLKGLDASVAPQEIEIQPGWHIALGRITMKYNLDNHPKRVREDFSVDSDGNFDTYVLHGRVEEIPADIGILGERSAQLLVVSRLAFVLVPLGGSVGPRNLQESCAVQENWQSLEDFEDHLRIERGRSNDDFEPF